MTEHPLSQQTTFGHTNEADDDCTSQYLLLGPQPKLLASKFALFLLKTSQKKPEHLHSTRKTLTELRGGGSGLHMW